MPTIRDPLWNNIPLDGMALRVVDTQAFQRLRYVRQLGLAHLVYPGATHSRFEHALGTYHLTRRTLALLEEQGAVAPLVRAHRPEITAAALLHDIGHYPFSHALEEIGVPHHESVATSLVTTDEIGEILTASAGPDAPARVEALIRGASDDPLQGLISGSLDLDKIEYLKRDAFMCGVPYGEIDVDRLVHSLSLLDDPATGQPVIGLLGKGLSALESLLFAKYQMYRNVYWHHAVRSATAMYKRLVEDALAGAVIDAQELAAFTDEGLLNRLEERAPTPLLVALRNRRLYKRAAELSAAVIPNGAADWIADDRARAVAAGDALGAELGLGPGELLLDYPAKPAMLGLDLPVRMHDGSVHRVTSAGWPGSIGLPALAESLYRSARVLRIFTARAVDLPTERVMEMVESAPLLRARGAPRSPPARHRS